MNYVALISGGKDSMYSIHKLNKQGYSLVGLLYMEDVSETIDSFMFQSVGSEVIQAYSECLNVPLFKYKTKSHCINSELNYIKRIGDEVEDLFCALEELKAKIDFQFVSSGAILSNYQKNRVEDVCGRLSLKALSPLWQMDQKQLLNDMIEAGINAVLVKVATSGLGKEWIGKGIHEIRGVVESIKYCNVCGEGGEYETIVLDMPYFVKRVRLKSYEVKRHPDEKEKEWNVYFMTNIQYTLETK